MSGTERLRADFRATVRDAVPELPYLSLVAAKVLQDHGNHTIDVEPLDGFLPMMTDVPYEVPFSGARCRVRAGAIVLVGFEGAVISRPHALAFRSGDLEFLRVECGACVLELDADAGRILIAAPIIEVTPTTRMQAGGGFGLGVDAASGAVTLRGATVDINP